MQAAEARELGVLQARESVRKMRVCSPCFSFVWKPTML